MKFNYEHLNVTANVQEFIILIYEIARQLPDFEKFGLQSQLRRSSTSVLLNLAEGSARKSRAEFVRFLNIAIGSLVEADAILKLSVKLSYIPESTRSRMDPLIEKTFFRLVALKSSQIK